MRIEVDGRALWLAVISTGRPQTYDRMLGLVGPATWYTRPADDYGDVKVEGLCAARNRALEDAFDQALPCCQLSDDLRGLKVLDQAGVARPAAFQEVLGDLLAALAHSHARLAGVAPTANPLYGGHRLRTAHYILGDLFLVRPSAPRFDERLPLKEDYDFTCQHLALWGAVARCDWLLADFAHRTNAGGAVAVRTPALEQEAIALLKAKWPSWIKDNARRPNEVLLRCDLSAVS